MKTTAGKSISRSGRERLVVRGRRLALKPLGVAMAGENEFDPYKD
jgi:hypothetical protein